MATQSDLRNIAKKRLSTVSILMDSQDWEMAAYMMGYTLECALKASACKTLNLPDYPPLNKNKEDAYFKTHQFEQLLIVSGLSHIFNPRGNVLAYRNWSLFTIDYSGDWIAMRYNESQMKKFNEVKVRELYNYLYDDKVSIIKTISGKRKW
jgi:succinate dehydrogenase flavin-adding protein (antitoxin of CptAB toxin-antitoxin module)